MAFRIIRQAIWRYPYMKFIIVFEHTVFHITRIKLARYRYYLGAIIRDFACLHSLPAFEGEYILLRVLVPEGHVSLPMEFVCILTRKVWVSSLPFGYNWILQVLLHIFIQKY